MHLSCFLATRARVGRHHGHRSAALWFLLAGAVFIIGYGCAPTSVENGAKEVTVFAAASLRDLAADLAAEFEAQEDVRVILNFAGSNTLAQQIKAAPGADVFLSADQQWIDFLDQSSRLMSDSKRPFLVNRLVLIARPEVLESSPAQPRQLADWLLDESFQHLSIADPEAVPAGRYAKAHLQRWRHEDSDLWSRVEERVAPALDVRAALQLVASDPRILGIVYLTDALASSRVRVLLELPGFDDLPILYWSARVADGREVEGQRFHEFLFSEKASAIAVRHGFSPADTL